jgi:hypothetical protein
MENNDLTFDKEEQDLWEKLGEIKTPNPSPESRTRFYAMLDTYQHELESKKENSFTVIFDRIKQLFIYKPAYRWAYALGLLIFGVTIGYFSGKNTDSQMLTSQEKVEKLSSEVQDMKQLMMLSMLENPMATERLKAVSYTQELNTVDDQVIDALLATLNFDQNENVRLVTLEALIQLAHHPKVREGLVQSLLKQESPLMQVALADAMVKLQEKRSVKQFKALLKKDNLNHSIKHKIEKTIQVLSYI